MIKQMMKSMAAQDEKESWDVKTEKYYRLNVQLNGMGLNREFPALDEKDKFYQGMGRTRAEVMVMVAAAKRKGLKPTLHLFERALKRLV